MKRIASIFIVAVGVSFGIARLTFPHPQEKASEDGERVKVLNSYDVKEKLDGKDATVTMVEVTFGPRQGGTSHRHPGPAFVYVVEGTYELGIDDRPTKIYKAGERFRSHRAACTESRATRLQLEIPS